MSKLQVLALGLGLWGVVAAASFLLYVFAGYAWWDYVVIAGGETGTTRQLAVGAFIWSGCGAGAFAVGIWLSYD